MFTLNCNGRLLVVDKPIIMAVINTTPDSFYSSSRQAQPEEVLRLAEKMLKDGASIIDIGGQSTRPGSTPVATKEELDRVITPIELLHRKFPEVIISVDTWSAEIAKEAVGAGASIINDISAGSIDDTMISTVADLGVPYVLMHMQGTPSTMQKNPQYENVTTEVLDFFIKKLSLLRGKGIKDIIIDPGFGFGKTIAHNFELLRNLPVFRIVDCPLLLGLSRKSTISKTLGVTAEEALNGTTVLNTIGLMNGANILRVHDVREAAEAIELFQAYKKAE